MHNTDHPHSMAFEHARMTVVCGVCLCMCMWLGGSIDLFAGWSILHFFRTRNLYELQFHFKWSTGKSWRRTCWWLWDVWVHDAEVVPSMYIFLTDSSLLLLSIYCDGFLWSAIGLDLTYFSALARLFFAFACTSVGFSKLFCDLSPHIFSWPSLPSGHSFMNPLSASS